MPLMLVVSPASSTVSVGGVVASTESTVPASRVSAGFAMSAPHHHAVDPPGPMSSTIIWVLLPFSEYDPENDISTPRDAPARSVKEKFGDPLAPLTSATAATVCQ